MDLTKLRQSDKETTLFEQYSNDDFTDIRNKYQDEGIRYCFEVLDGKKITGYNIKLACYRHLRDLKRVESNASDFPFYYDLNKCKQVMNFAKICPNVDTGKPVDLMEWQNLILCQIFGWRDENTNKRYSSVIVSDARAQGKTYLCAIIACYAFR